MSYSPTREPNGRVSPTDSKANDEYLHFFAELGGVARARVRIVTGATSRLKVVEIEGVEQSELENLL
ncbi:MAG: DUF167 family protein [Ignavibacteriota bacterium]